MRPRDELEEAGERIEAALHDLDAIDDPRVRELAMGALQLVVGLYGDALERVLEVVGSHAPAALAPLAADDLVSSLLIVHDLHPEPVSLRVERALDYVRPYLGSHGGDVDLLGVEEGVVRLRLMGNCDGCPSSSVTLQLAVEGAITKAAPEVVDIEVVGEPEPAVSSTPLIPAESLLVRPEGFGGGAAATPQAAPTPSWRALAADLLPGPGATTSTEIDGLRVLLARTPGGLYAYRDACPTCTSDLREGGFEPPVLACPGCGGRFDVEAAGRDAEGGPLHLDPLPLIERSGTVELAVPRGAVT
jgi:Fe-S cluster biogenesis protein NfuA/nitrite reductase/ring-hydroxylating ferredoxin subunit